MKVTVISSSLNRQVTLERLFNCLAEQTVVPDQVIVVEAGDACPAHYAAPAIIKDRLTVFHAPKESLAASRERGRLASQGDVLIFLDDDILLNKDYIKTALDYLAATPNVMAVGGAYRDDDTNLRRPWSIWIGRLLGIYGNGSRNRILCSGWTDYVRGQHAEEVTDAEWLFGCNWVIRASAFNEPSVKIETRLAAWSFLEDVILGFRITQAYGPCMKILPRLRVIHDAPTSSGRITRATLRMRILYRYVFWRKNFSNKGLLRTGRFWLGMFANLLLMIKQERKVWVVSECLGMYRYILSGRHIDWDSANEVIFSKN